MSRLARIRTTLLLLLTALSPALAQNSNGSFLTGPPADTLWNQMSQSPYTQTGDRGLVVYMVSYSSCANCIVFLRDFWESHRDRMQLREIFAPVNQPRFLDEAADMALTRSPESAEAYYKHAKVAPPVNSSPDRKAALQKVVDFNTALNATFTRIGHIRDGYPTFILRHKESNGQDRVLIISGWSQEVARDMDRWVTEAAH